MTTTESPVAGGVPGLSCKTYANRSWLSSASAVPAEMALTIYINNQEVVTVLCTPTKLNCLVLGFLYSEGIISGLGDVVSMRICEDEPVADVRLSRDYTPPTRRVLTSGCGGGTSFKVDEHRLNSAMTVRPDDVLLLMKQLQQQQPLFKHCGGVHGSALCSSKQILVAAEDIGRHNTLDKIVGECLLRKIPTRDGILLTTGRISSEMLLKAARMQTPVIVSRGSSTSRAIELGQELGISIIGYARAGRLSVYSHEERLPAAALDGPG
ncbi:MAG: formate dehydrogenase accessory sulfurtransferase FdhD [Chloroflexi bacterium]|nr:formate dehydrogenase accessory sulfurtransferase FdhD [Chloroflexota bacterium]